jgi:hypothetical protein
VRLRSVAKYNDFIGNRTRDHQTCSIVPEPTTLPRFPMTRITLKKKKKCWPFPHMVFFFYPPPPTETRCRLWQFVTCFFLQEQDVRTTPKRQLSLRVVIYIKKIYTVDSRLSAVMVRRIGADNRNQRINRSTHTQLNLGCLHPVARVISYDMGLLFRLRNFNIV